MDCSEGDSPSPDQERAGRVSCAYCPSTYRVHECRDAGSVRSDAPASLSLPSEKQRERGD